MRAELESLSIVLMKSELTWAVACNFAKLRAVQFGQITLIDNVHWRKFILSSLNIFLEMRAAIIIELCAPTFVPSHLEKLEEIYASRKSESREMLQVDVAVDCLICCMHINGPYPKCAQLCYWLCSIGRDLERVERVRNKSQRDLMKLPC